MRIKIRLPIVGLGHVICKVVMMISDKYQESKVCHLGNASIRAKHFGEQESVNIIFRELTLFFSLTGLASLR
jgi:hypothetical protein